MRNVKRALWTSLLLLAVCILHPVRADAVLITFDEVASGTSMEGTSIGIVTFGSFFPVPGVNQLGVFGGIGPAEGGGPSGPFASVDHPSALIEGNNLQSFAGFAFPFRLTFSEGVNRISFDSASAFAGPPGAAIVTIFDVNGNNIGSATGTDVFHQILTGPLAGAAFRDGSVSITSAIPIFSAEISFVNGNQIHSFYLDNLDVRSVPEASSLLALGAGLLMLGAVLARRRRR